MNQYIHCFAFWLIAFGMSHGSTIKSEEDILTFERASFELEMHGNIDNALSHLFKLSRDQSSIMHPSANILLGKYYLNTSDTSKSISHFLTAYTNPAIQPKQRNWLGTLLKNIGISSMPFILPAIENPSPLKHLIQSQNTLYMLSQSNELFQFIDNEFQPLYIAIPHSDTLITLSDTLIVHLNSQRNVVTIQQLLPSKKTSIFRTETPVRWIERTPNNHIYINTQDQIFLLNKNKQMWNRPKEIGETCSFVTFINYNNAIAEMCPDNNLILRSLLNGKIIHQHSLHASPLFFHQTNDGLITVFKNSIQKISIDDKLLPSWNISTTSNSSGYIKDNYFYHLNSTGTLSKINTLSGETVWSQNTPNVAITDLANKIGGYTATGALYAYDFSGKKMWHYNYGSPFTLAPITYGSRILIGTDKEIIQLNNNYYGTLPTKQDRQFEKLSQAPAINIKKSIKTLNQILKREPGNSKAHQLKASLCLNKSGILSDCLSLVHTAAIHTLPSEEKQNSLLKNYAQLIGADWVKHIHTEQNISPTFLLDSAHLYQIDNRGIFSYGNKKLSEEYRISIIGSEKNSAAVMDSSHIYSTKDSLLLQIELNTSSQLSNTLKVPGIITTINEYTDVLIVLSSNNSMHLIQKDPFSINWSINFPIEKVFLPNTISKENIAVITENGFIHNLNRNTGALLNNFSISSSPIVDVSSDSSTLFIANNSRQLIAKKQLSMNTIWTTDFNDPIVSIYNAPQHIFAENSKGYITCILKANGQELWNVSPVKPLFLFTRGASLYVAAGKSLYSYSIETGKLIDSKTYPDVLSDYILQNNILILITKHRFIYGITLK
ncbi:MAG: PQQ-binding-like beta-propeller repeat protein [Reichenbachiella sp.]